MERSIAMIVRILGIMKSGGAYVPIDPTYPRATDCLYAGRHRLLVYSVQHIRIARCGRRAIRV